MTSRIRNLCLMYAVDRNGVIGKNNDMPWRSPQDFRWFRSQTMGSSVIMGRKTWESLPSASRPLHHRDNYVLSSNPDYVAPGAIVVTSLSAAIELALRGKRDSTVYAIGGKAVLEEASKIAYRANISHIGVDTPVDDTCVMAPKLPDYELHAEFELFVGDARNPSVTVHSFVFTDT